MTITEKIIAKSGVELLVEKRIMEDWVEISIGLKDHKKCLLHWGLRHHVQALWEMPPRSVWPEGSKAFGKQAIQTPFAEKDGVGRIVIRLDRTLDFFWFLFSIFPRKIAGTITSAGTTKSRWLSFQKMRCLWAILSSQ